MKPLFNKNSCCYLFILLIVTFSFFNCNLDDNDEIETLCTTFLECNAETKWKHIHFEKGVEFSLLYYKFNDNYDLPIEIWVNYLEEDCFCYLDISTVQFQILENSKDSLVLKIIFEEDDSETWTFTIEEKSLRLARVFTAGGLPIESYTFFNKTAVNLDEIIICKDSI